MTFAHRIMAGMAPAVSAPPGGAPTLVQSPAAPGFSFGATYQMTLTGVTAGSTLVAVYPIRDTAPRAFLGISDEVNGEYTVVHQESHAADNNLWLYSGYVENSGAGDVTVTITWSGSVSITAGAFFEISNSPVVERDHFDNALAQANPQFCAQAGGLSSAGNPAFGIGFITASGNAFHGAKAGWTAVGNMGDRSEVYYRQEDVAFVAERCDINAGNTSRINLGGLLFVR